MPMSMDELNTASPSPLGPRTFDWNLLHTFVAIVEAGSISAGAERLGRKQPTVSSALQQLEARIGRRLIDRGPGQFSLTGAGRVLFDEAREICGAVTRLDTLVRERGDMILGRVSVAIASHVVCPLVDETLAAFHSAHPAATLSFDVMASVKAVAEVRARRASMAICLTDRSDASLDYMHLYREYFGLYCGPTHPLFGRKGLTLDAVRGQRSVRFLTDRPDDVLRPVALLREEAGMDDRIVAQSSHLEEVRRLTIAGLGISALPVHVVARDVEDGLLWRLPPYDAPPAVDVFVVRNPAMRLNRAETAFTGELDRRIAATPLERRTYS